MSILITAGLSPHAYRIQRLLNTDEVIFADESEMPAIPGRRNLTLPAAESASFAHEVLKACLDHQVSHVYPLKWGEVLELSKASLLFEEYGIVLVIPSTDWLQNNRQQTPLMNGNIAILNKGELQAGMMPPGALLEDADTGIYTWATLGEKLEYSLYIV